MTQTASIRSGACILITNKHTDQGTFRINSKTDQDTGQET